MPSCANHPYVRASVPLDAAWLCTPCFIRCVESKVRAAIKYFSMISDGDRVAVGLSGGKDSSALLLILKGLAPRIGISHLIAITVDEGISGYGEEALRLAGELTEEKGVEHEVVRFADIFGVDIDALSSRGGSLCSACGVLRRRALDIAARERGCDVIATGHTREDNAQTFLMNIFRGESERLARTGPTAARIEGFIPRIKPLSYLGERETVLYSYFSGIKFQTRACPHRTESLRLQVLTMLKRMGGLDPEIPAKLARAFNRARVGLNSDGGKAMSSQFVKCTACGYPSASSICKVCQVVGKTDRHHAIA
jgi:uncharacterized protein (TIGR00269 family)